MDSLKHLHFDAEDIHSQTIVHLLRRFERPFAETAMHTYNLWKEAVASPLPRPAFLLRRRPTAPPPWRSGAAAPLPPPALRAPVHLTEAHPRLNTSLPRRPAASPSRCLT